jgi:release factor glutamine methyltransferase
VTTPGTSVALQNVGELLATASVALGSRREARWVVAQCAGLRAGDLGARADMTVSPAVAHAVHDMVARRQRGEPLQYVLGTWAFRTLELRVDPRVLIPRPETEQVAAAALEELRAQAALVAPRTRLVAADLGTGSGAIALSLAAELDRTRSIEIWASDVSGDALEVLEQNLALLAQGRPEATARVRVAKGSWFGALPPRLTGHLRLVVSNPPYVARGEWDALDEVVRRHEPPAALVSGPTGLEAIELLLHQAPLWLAPGGSLVLELAPDQADIVRARAVELGYERVEIRDDLARRPRMLVARSPGT